VEIWYSFQPFGTLCPEKSGNPERIVKKLTNRVNPDSEVFNAERYFRHLLQKLKADLARPDAVAVDHADVGVHFSGQKIRCAL
jgi:hypothetical protein